MFFKRRLASYLYNSSFVIKIVAVKDTSPNLYSFEWERSHYSPWDKIMIYPISLLAATLPHWQNPATDVNRSVVTRLIAFNELWCIECNPTLRAPTPRASHQQCTCRFDWFTSAIIEKNNDTSNAGYLLLFELNRVQCKRRRARWFLLLTFVKYDLLTRQSELFCWKCLNIKEYSFLVFEKIETRYSSSRQGWKHL